MLAIVVATGVMILSSIPAPGTSPQAEPQAAAESATADVVYATASDRDSDTVEPVAICRLIPECSSNSDCDDRCGAGLGKCVHSNCPVRICRCR